MTKYNKNNKNKTMNRNKSQGHTNNNHRNRSNNQQYQQPQNDIMQYGNPFSDFDKMFENFGMPKFRGGNNGSGLDNFFGDFQSMHNNIFSK